MLKFDGSQPVVIGFDLISVSIVCKIIDLDVIRIFEVFLFLSYLSPRDQVVKLNQPIVIKPHATVVGFSVHFSPNASDSVFSTVLELNTNASEFAIPIHCYHGKLVVRN